MANGNPASPPPSRFSGGLPDNTPIEKLGITPQAATHLTSAAARLTKKDLVELRETAAIATELNLHVKDIDSIRAAFSHPTNPAPATVSLASSCCCTPCCCAASVLTRDTKVA